VTKLTVTITTDFKKVSSSSLIALNASALYPNVFFEAWIFEYVIKRFYEHLELIFLEVKNQSQELVGFFPFVKSKNLFFTTLELPSNIYSFLGNPLIKKGEEALVFNSIYQALDNEFKFWCIKFTDVDERILELATGYSKTKRINSFERKIYDLTNHDKDSIIKDVTDKLNAKSLRKKYQSLKQQGFIYQEDSRESRITDFLNLEDTSWKGEQKTSILSNKSDVVFFQQAITAGIKEKRVIFHILADATDIAAISISFKTHKTLFRFKTAYNNCFAKESPGLILEYLIIKTTFSNDFEVIDSCGSPESELSKRCYNESKSLSSGFLVPQNNLLSNLPEVFFKALMRFKKSR
jgi:CelD/BcsL family acetyltransferase involved in cellulose biosynthesis